jgi:hypothetical protein
MGKDKSYWENKGVRRYVLDPEDVDELERESGVHEFINKKPREEAEDAAYGDYTKKHHMQGAAHHLTRMKAAQANGNYGDAKRHKILYDMHLKEMGVEAKDGKVPDEVTQHMQNPDAPQPMKFKAHKADTFFLNDKEAKPSEEAPVTKTELAKKILDMAKRLEAKHAEPVTLSKTLGDHAWAELTESLVKSGAFGYSVFQSGRNGDASGDPGGDHGSGIKKLVAGLGAATLLGAGAGAGYASNKFDPPGTPATTITQPKIGGAVIGGAVGQGLGLGGVVAHVAGGMTLAALRARARRKPGMGKSELAKARAIGTQQADPKIQKRPEQDVEDTVDYAKDPEDRMQVPPGFKAKAKPKQVDRLANKEQDPDDHGNPKEIAQDRAEDKREEAAYRKEQTKRYGSDEPAYKAEKPYMGRDEGIRRSKLPPGAPGSSKDGVGVHVDKKKAADKKAARGKVKPE